MFYRGEMFGKIHDFIYFELNRRLLLYVTLFFILGITVFDRGLLPPSAAAAFLAVSLSGLLLVKRAAPVFILLLAFFFAGPYCHYRSGYPPKHLKNYTGAFGYQRVELTGTLAADPEFIRSSSSATLLLEAESFKIKGAPVINTAGLVKISLKEKIDPGELNYGDKIAVYARFHAPAGPKNPGEFDYRRYLERKKIFLLGSVNQAEGDSLEKTCAGGGNKFISWTIGLKHRLLRVLEATTAKEEAYLIQGVLLGEDASLSAKRKQQFRATGTFHILAVSGFNVALVVAAFFFIMRLLKYGKKFSAAVSIGFVLVFCFVTGCSPSVVRATLLSVFVLTALLLERDFDLLNLLALSALVMLFYEPVSLFDIGFQLSYLATLGLVLLASRLEEYLSFLPRWLGGAVAVTVSAQLFVTPAAMMYFNSLSTLTLPANLLIAPFVWFSTVAGFLQAVIGLIFLPAGSIIGFINALSVNAMFKIVEYFSAFSFAVLQVSSPGLFFLPVYYTAVFALVYFKELYKEKTVLAAVLFGLLAAAVWLNIYFTGAAKCELTVFSLRNAKAVLVHAGSGSSVLYVEGKIDAYEAERKLLAALRKKGINTLSALVYSEEFESYVPEFCPQEKIKLAELKNKSLKITGRGGAVFYIGGKAILSGRLGSQVFYADHEKVIYGGDRQAVYYKEVRKKTAFVVELTPSAAQGKYW